MASGVGENMSFYVDLEVHAAAHLVAEKLDAEWEGRTTVCGLPEYDGLGVGGARLWRQQTPHVQVRSGEKRRWQPEPSVLWVSETLVGGTIRTALSGPPFRFGSAGPGPTGVSRENRTIWDRLVRELRAQGWRWESGCEGDGLIQADGHLPTGEEFYLNFKYDTCYIEVGAALDWSYHELPYPQAGYMHPAEAVRVLHELHAVWLTR